MICRIFGWTIAVALVLLAATAARAQTLSLEIHLGNLETWISNNTAVVISSDGYQISSASGILDPVNWQSIDDSATSSPAALSAALGSGALSFIEVSPTSNNLTEFDLASTATWQPGTRWSIGFPFGTSPGHFQSRPFDARFEYTAAFGGVSTGSIEFIPEPACLTFAVTALLGIAFTRRRRLRA